MSDAASGGILEYPSLLENQSTFLVTAAICCDVGSDEGHLCNGGDELMWRRKVRGIYFDFVSLLLQAASGAIANTANTVPSNNTGFNTMIAGLAWQVFSLSLFANLCSEFAYRVYKVLHSELNANFAFLRMRFQFKAFIGGLGVAVFAIFIRSCYRCAKLSGGFHGKLPNQQITFMVLEGAMVIIAVAFPTIFHHGVAFCGAWEVAGWSLRKAKNAAVRGNQEEKKRWGMKGMPWQRKSRAGEAKGAKMKDTPIQI